jgi:tetratricopeptide (TPR) repeat protein
LTASEPDRVHATHSPEAPVQAQPAYDAELEAAEKARRAALEKSARITRLVRKIERALAGAPEAGNPQILIAKLARIKGKHHPYVAKLRAYWNFQRGRYDLAEADLSKVIAANPDDLEAGINLALIEIHDQRYHEAMKRLKQLRHTYPENPQIADLIKRLR